MENGEWMMEDRENWRMENGEWSIASLARASFDPQLSIFHPQSSILDLPSSLFHPPSSILNLQSSIFHPQCSILNLPSSIFHPQSSILNLPSSIFHPPPSPLAAGGHNRHGSIDGGQTDDRRRFAKLNHAWTIPRPHRLLALNRSALNR